MAITPDEARQLSEEDQAFLATCEATIDAKLRAEKGEPTHVELEPISHDVERELRRRYERAGWIITIAATYRERRESYGDVEKIPFTIVEIRPKGE
jgi:hypothetical protein